MSLLSIRGRLNSLLTRELELRVPQFEPHAMDYQMVVYTCRDFEIWLRTKWNIDDPNMIYQKLEEQMNDEHGDFKFFLGLWVSRWLEKWRERVKVLSIKPKLPPQYLDRIKKARKLYREMEYGKELKEMVIRKLVNHGEICMSELIAENLIVEEIVKRIQIANDDSKCMKLNLLELFNSISITVSRLPKEKGPLIYLNIKPFTL